MLEYWVGVMWRSPMPFWKMDDAR